MKFIKYLVFAIIYMVTGIAIIPVNEVEDFINKFFNLGSKR